MTNQWFQENVIRRFSFKKLRIMMAWFGGIVLFLNSNSSEESFRIGIPTVILGESIRVWSLGYLERKGERLATDGPYAHVRNPLYWGNFLIGLGVVIITRNIWIGLIFLLGFSLLYAGTVKQEEKDLEKFLGEPYLTYKKHVPRYLPRLTRYEGRGGEPYQVERLWRNREHVTLLGLPLLLGALYIWEQLFLEKEFEPKHLVYVGFTAALIIALLLERTFRDRKPNPSK